MAEETKSKENTRPKYYVEIIEYFLKHPAISGSCIYILFSALGVVYSWKLYNEFEINIFDYAEANDFLLILFKQPHTFLNSIVGILISAALIITMYVSNKFNDKISKFFSVLCLLSTLMIICVPFMISYRYFVSAEANALEIKLKEPTITVLYEEGKRASTSVVKELKSSLIGSTDKFMFFYNPSDENTIVIPITKIISVTTNTKRQRS